MKRMAMVFCLCIAALAAIVWTASGFSAHGETRGKAHIEGGGTTNIANFGLDAAAVAALRTVKPEVLVTDAFLRLTGSLTSESKSEVASTANGTVLEVCVERGDMVKKDAVLVKIDPTDLENMRGEATAGIEEIKAALGWPDTSKPYVLEDQPGVKMAKAALDLAETNYTRFDNLRKENNTSQISFDQRKMEYDTAKQSYENALNQTDRLRKSYDTAQAKLKTLDKMIADTIIKAPFDGWIAERYVYVGERVTTSPMGSGARIVSLVKLDPLRLVLTVPEQHAPAVHEGQQVNFTVQAFPGKQFTGTIKYIGPAVDIYSRSMMVEAVVPNPEKLLRPGFFASAELILPEKEQSLLIPESAIVPAGESHKVFVVRDGKLFECVVSVEKGEDGKAVVKSGLTPEDAVVLVPDTIVKKAEDAS